MFAIKSAVKLQPGDDAEGKCARFVEELLE
jgi:hypothetical protein